MVIVCALVWRYDIWFCIFCDMLLGWKKFWMLVSVLSESLSMMDLFIVSCFMISRACEIANASAVSIEQ